MIGEDIFFNPMPKLLCYALILRKGGSFKHAILLSMRACRAYLCRVITGVIQQLNRTHAVLNFYFLLFTTEATWYIADTYS